MVAIFNNFEGGPSGTSLTAANSNQTGTQNAFNTVAAGTLQLLYADAGQLGRPTAQYVVKLTSGSPGDYQYASWSTAMGIAKPQIWTRFYFYVTSTATVAGVDDLNLFTVSTAANVDLVGVYLRNTSSPAIMQIFNCGTNAFANGSVTILPNTWNRVEFRCLIAGGAGSADLFLYSGLDVDTDTATEHVTQTLQNYGSTNMGIYTIGNFHNFQTAAPVTYFSNWALNDTGYPGPAPFRLGHGSPAGNLTNPIAIHSAVD
jgi:hypothetical protein